MISTTTFPEFTDRPKDTAKTISGQTIDETVQAAIAEVSKSLTRIHPKSEEEVILQLLVRSGAISRSLFEAWYSASQANSMIAPKYLEIAMLAARSPNTTPEILAYLAMIDIGAWIELYPNAPFAMLEKYALIANLKLKIAIASNPNTPAKILEDFAREYTAIEQFVERLGSSVMDACDRASSLIEVSPEISEKLIANQFSSDEEYYKYIMELLYIVASHPHTPAKVLASMEWYTRKNDSTRAREKAIVLINPSQPREYTKIRRGAIANPNFPQNLLEQIFRAGADVVWGHDDAWHYCIKNPQLSMECIKDLVTYKPMWRAEMADHPNMPFAILEISAQSFNPNEKFKIVRNPALPAHLIRQFVKDTDTYLVLADNLMVDAEVLTTITNYMCNVYPLQQDTKRSLDIHCLQKIAAHPNTPISILYQLAEKMGKPYNYLGDKNAQIPVYGEGLSRNPYLPDAIAQKLIDSECTDCKEYAQVLTQVIFHHPHLLTHVLERYFSSSLLRMIILFHDKTSIACLEQASRSANWLERYLVAKHLNTPDSIREQLKRDDNPIVCESAKNAL